MRGQIVGTGAQQTWRRLTSAPVGNTPIGTIHAIYTNVCPTGYLPCDGSAYDTTQFPDLYALLQTAGVTNPDHTPDFRECALIGVGTNSTDTLGTHDIYTLGQFKDCQAQDGSLGLKSAGYNVSGNNITLNTTVNAANRKLVTQYVADASATDLQTITTGSSGALTTRNRSKGVYFIIKAIVGNEVSDINQLADDLRAEMALCLQLKIVDTLPTGTDVTTDMYLYNGAYYMGQVDEADPTQSVCVPIGGGGTGNANIFVGTQAEWDALTTAEKNEYSQANITDVNSVVHVPVDVVADGNMNPVTSNAVYDALAGNIIVEEVSIAMNHSSTSPFTEGLQSVAKTGYTAIGVAGHGHLGAAGNTLYKSFVMNNRYYFGVTGPGNNTNVPIYIIYKKN